MDWSKLLQWHYMIFLLPFALAAVMLILSVLQMGDGDSDSADGGDADVADGDMDADGGDAGEGDADGDAHGKGLSVGGVSPVRGVLRALGVGKMPMLMVLETFSVSWGFCGFWANQLLVKAANPTLTQMLPSLGIAAVGGVLGARLSAEVMGRIFPPSETKAISRQQLIGRTGKVVFPVSADAGRIRIYDENRTLFEEPCRIEPGHPPIEKGRTAIVTDKDAKGRLIVEELPDSRS